MEKHSYLYPHSTNGIMKDFQLHKTISIFLLIGFSLLSSEQVKSQLINCDQMTAFLGDATTLCETYPSFTPTITLGNGINNASQVGTSLSGNILIVGDFKIDQNFTFSNAIIKINNNVKIIVQSSFISFDIGYSNLNNKRIKLTINNSKLFACSGLWKGIQMTSFTDLILNDVQIEDAQKAVNAINTFAVTLDIRYTTFNRNQYGIYLSNTPFYVFDPVFRRFIQNNFYCTSPINGTDEGASNAGIYLENITASLIAPVIYQYTHFEDQFIGVQLVGSQTTLKASLFVFGRCWNEGILMDNGSSLELDNSTFNEVNFRGIYGKKFKNLTLIQCHFNTEDLDNQRALDCQFVFLESMPNGGKILIDDSDFETMDALEGKQIEGITILAPTNGANVEMAVTECNFDLEAGKVRGIFLSGAFPESSNFSIENNYFDIRRNNGADVTESAIGLYSYGNKNNLRIHNNQFTGNNFFCAGISIEITNGIWNEISGNEFIGGYVNLLASIPRLNSGLYLRSAQNITVCDNTDYFTCDAAFRFYKSCLNTNFTLNTMYAGGASLTLFQVGSVISEQYQAGNKFIPVVVSIFGTNFSYPPSAVCEDYAVASLSLFTVHKPQSFWDDVAQDWDPLEIYHPWKVTPDSDIYTDAFFVDPPDDNGSPATFCKLKSFTSADTIDKLIALDSLDSIFENDAEKFDAKLYLYKRLKNEPDYFSLFNPFKDFVDINKSANIGYIYEIEKYIEKALTRPANEVDTIQVYYDLVSSIIYNIDSIIAITTWSESNRTYLNQMRDDLSRVQIKLDSLDLIYDVHKQLYLDSAWALLPQIDTSEGDYFKFYETYLQYRIQILDEGYTSLDTNDSQTLLTLADNCPVNSGSAVGGIQGLLNYCSYLSLQESIYACQPTMTIDTLHPLLIDSSPFMKYDYWVKADENGVLGNIDKKGQFQNPDEVFTTKVSIYSLDGRKIKELSSVDQEIRYTSFANIWSDLPEGLYLIMKRTSDNQILTYKYFNSHK